MPNELLRCHTGKNCIQQIPVQEATNRWPAQSDTKGRAMEASRVNARSWQLEPKSRTWQVPTENPEAKPRIRNQGSCQGIRDRAAWAQFAGQTVWPGRSIWGFWRVCEGEHFLSWPLSHAISQALPDTSYYWSSTAHFRKWSITSPTERDKSFLQVLSICCLHHTYSSWQALPCVASF